MPGQLPSYTLHASPGVDGEKAEVAFTLQPIQAFPVHPLFPV